MDSSGLITIFVPSLGPGGVKRAMINLCSGLKQLDYEVHFVTADASGPYRKEASKLVDLYNLSSDGPVETIRNLRTYLLSNDPDAVISTHTHGNVTAFLSSLGSDTAHVFTEHSLLSHRNQYVDTNMKDRIVNRVARVGYPHADAIVTVSGDVKADMADFLNMNVSNAQVIHNPVDLERVRSLSEVSSNHPWLEDRSTEVVVAAGRFDPRKDFCTLVDAMAQVKRDTDIKLVILGDGDEKSKIEDRIRHHSLEEFVDLVGWIDNPFSYMSEADGFVLSSKSEGFANVLVEAIACECPPVATRCPGGPREILADGKFGELVPVGDAEALANGIISVVKSPPNPELLEARADDFSVETITNKYANLLDTL